jgi:inner membrane transporter RhtA
MDLPMQKVWPYLAVLAAISCIQGGAGLGKALFGPLGVAGTTFYRLLFSGGLLLLLHRPWRQPLVRAQYRAIATYALSLVAMNWLIYLAIERIPLGIAVAIEFCGPLALALFTARRWDQWIWAGLTVGGLGLLLPANALSTSLDPLGLLFALGAGVGWAAYILGGQRSHGQVPPGAMSAYGLSFAALGMLPAACWLDGGRLGQLHLWPAALGMAIVCSAIPYSLELFAMSRIETHSFSILMSVEPAIAALSGLWTLGEQLAARQWVGIGGIVAAALGSSLMANRQRGAG